jgi:hypothetical protein
LALAFLFASPFPALSNLQALLFSLLASISPARFSRPLFSAEPRLQHWMLPMLLGTYGRLRQADKAWAVYRRLLELEDGRRSGEAAALPSAAAERQRHAGAAGPAGSHPFEGLDSETEPGSGSSSAAQHTQRPQQREQLQQQPRGPGGVGAADWQARLAARRAAVSGEAGALVAGLRLDAAPLTQYTYSALLTALSRVRLLPGFS